MKQDGVHIMIILTASQLCQLMTLEWKKVCYIEWTLYINNRHIIGECVTIFNYQCQPLEHEDGLSAGVITGIVIGSIAALLLFVAFVIMIIITIKVKIVPACQSYQFL